MMLDVEAIQGAGGRIVAWDGLVDQVSYAGLFCLWSDRAWVAVLLNDQFGMRLPRRHR